MKWPMSVTLIRHDTSAYNVLRDEKRGDPLYQEFLELYKENEKRPLLDQLRLSRLASQIQERFALKVGDAETPLADKEGTQAYQTGVALSSTESVCGIKATEIPDVIFVSPYERARLTLEHLIRGWPELASVETYEEERIREQEHGLSLLYNDWRVFHVLHPEQKTLYKQEGPYWYRYPQGENVPDVRDRNRSWLNTLVRDFAGKKVLAVTHHLNILAMRANLERLGEQEFIRLDTEEKPINCGVTTYEGVPNQGKDGRLLLKSYNVKYY